MGTQQTSAETQQASAETQQQSQRGNSAEPLEIQRVNSRFFSLLHWKARLGFRFRAFLAFLLGALRGKKKQLTPSRLRTRRIGAERSGTESPAPPRIAPLRPAPVRRRGFGYCFRLFSIYGTSGNREMLRICVPVY